MQLSQRAKRILFAVVTEYIETGEPVGSRTLAKRYGLDLSAASIRNVLSDLEEGGLLFQSHTSAGRTPTERAIRFFIDMLVEMPAVAPEGRNELRSRVAHIYANSADPLGDSGKLLSALSGNAAVVARQTRGRTLAQLRFIPTKPGQILAVLVFEDGTVENRFVSLDQGSQPISEASPRGQPSSRPARWAPASLPTTAAASSQAAARYASCSPEGSPTIASPSTPSSERRSTSRTAPSKASSSAARSASKAR